MSRRDAIRMSDPEIRDFLEASRTLILCSQGRDGVPHPMPMWYGVDEDGAVIMTTFAKSQKVKNLERDPRVSLLIEDGTVYSELRGAVIYGKAELVDDTEKVLDILSTVSMRNQPIDAEAKGAMRKVLAKTAPKRIGIRVVPDRIVTWDHRKLAGAY